MKDQLQDLKEEFIRKLTTTHFTPEELASYLDKAAEISAQATRERDIEVVESYKASNHMIPGKAGVHRSFTPEEIAQALRNFIE